MRIQKIKIEIMANTSVTTTGLPFDISLIKHRWRDSGVTEFKVTKLNGFHNVGSPDEEKARLYQVYGEKSTNEAFPGSQFEDEYARCMRRYGKDFEEEDLEKIVNPISVVEEEESEQEVYKADDTTDDDEEEDEEEDNDSEDFIGDSHDLTQIKGISETRQKALNEMDIHTISDLAEADPEKVQDLRAMSLAGAKDVIARANAKISD